MIKELFMKKEVPANFDFDFFNDKEAGLIYNFSNFFYKGFNKKEIVGSKWTFKISIADCIPRTFLIEKVAWKSALIGKHYPRYAKMKFLSTGHASIWWDQVQVRRQRKGKGKYMRQDKMRSRLRDKFRPSD